MRGIVLMQGHRSAIPWTGRPLEILYLAGWTGKAEPLANRFADPSARPGRAGRQPPPCRVPSTSLVSCARAWLLSRAPDCHRLAHYSSSIPGRDSHDTIPAADGGQKNTLLQATAGNPVTGSEWIATC
jgi:hypothetical protein